jgi:transcription initiation factor TFIIF subunit alpha
VCLLRYNFSKIAQYKQLTLEEAEEKMKKRRSSATGYERWMMKSATHGPAAFGSDLKNLDNVNGKAAGGIQSKKENTNKDGDKDEEDKEERAPRKNAHGLTTKGVDDDDEEGGIEDFDLDFDTEIGMQINTINILFLIDYLLFERAVHSSYN